MAPGYRTTMLLTNKRNFPTRNFDIPVGKFLKHLMASTFRQLSRDKAPVFPGRELGPGLPPERLCRPGIGVQSRLGHPAPHRRAFPAGRALHYKDPGSRQPGRWKG